MRCQKCGMENQEGDLYCIHCGGSMQGGDSGDSPKATRQADSADGNRFKSLITKTESDLERENAKKKRWRIVRVSVILGFVLAILLVIFVVDPAVKLKNAKELVQAGEYIAAFETLDGLRGEHAAELRQYTQVKIAEDQAASGRFDMAFLTLDSLESEEADALRYYFVMRKTLIQAEKEPVASYREEHIERARELLEEIGDTDCLDERFYAYAQEISALLDTLAPKVDLISQFTNQLTIVETNMSQIGTLYYDIKNGESFMVGEVRDNLAAWSTEAHAALDELKALYPEIREDDFPVSYSESVRFYVDDVCDFLLGKMDEAEAQGRGISNPARYNSIGGDWVYWDLQRQADALSMGINAAFASTMVDLAFDDIYENCDLNHREPEDTDLDTVAQAQEDMTLAVQGEVLAEINKDVAAQPG